MCGGAFALDGVLHGASGKANVISTRYFDIIYTPDSEYSARKIEKVCDGYYLEICGLLKTEPYQRFPVTVTHQVESMNAYFTPLPYNRIVLFDTYPDNLDMYENTIESVFYHELTHAVTLNIKGDVFRKLSFFSDMINPSWLFLSTFWLEGATVYFESRTSDKDLLPHGRLNDPYSTLLAVQAKIDGKFPSWRDVNGNRDTYPGGTDAYIFGSEFVRYLCKKYGEEKYAEFWRNCGSRIVPESMNFRKVYGISLGDAWADFKENLEVPAVRKPEEIPEITKLLKAAFGENKKKRITCFDSNRNGFVFFDRYSSCIRFCRYDNKTNEYSKPEHLLTARGITGLSLSEDARYLLLSASVQKDNIKSKTILFDVENHRMVCEIGSSLAMASFIDGNEDSFEENGCDVSRLELVAVKSDSFPKKMERYSVAISHRKILKDSVTVQKVSELQFGDEEYPYSPRSAGNGCFAAIIKNRLDFTIRVYDAFSSEYTEYELNTKGSDILPIIHDLHSIRLDDGRYAFVFSYAALGMSGKMLPRAGILLDGVMTLQNEDLSGAVLKCMPLADFSQEKFSIAFVSEHYDHDKLWQMVLPQQKEGSFLKIAVGNVQRRSSQNKKNGTEHEKTYFKADTASKNSEYEQKTVSPIEKKYDPFAYFLRGSLFPVGSVNVLNHKLETDVASYLGFSYMTSNPWGDKNFMLSGAFDGRFGCYGAEAAFSGGNDAFNYSLLSSVIGNKKGFMQAYGNLSLSKLIFSGLSSSVQCGFKAEYFYGKQIIDEDFEDNVDDTKLKYPRMTISLTASNKHKAGPGVFDVSGLSFSAFVLGSFRRSDYLPNDKKYLNPGFFADLSVPFVLPLTFTAGFFPAEEVFASGSVRAILFSKEIQKGIPYTCTYLNRFVISAEYSGKIEYVPHGCFEIRNTRKIIDRLTSEDYSDAIALRAMLELTPNIGFFASDSFKCSLGASFIFRPNPAEDKKKNEVVFSFNVAM